MTLDSATRAEICRMAKVDKMSINAISQELKVHHTTVSNALKEVYRAFPSERQFPPILKPHENIIKELLGKYSKLQAKSLKRLLKDRGIGCSVTTAGRVLRHLKSSSGVAYGIRTVLSGQEGQVDWGEKIIPIGNKRQKVYFFAMILSFSRHLFAKATRDMKAATFMCCHTEAFLWFQGVVRRNLYDNLRTAVVERIGDNIRFSRSFYDYTAHYLFEPVACHVRTPEEKGRIERQISNIKNNFLNGREFSSFEDLNHQLQVWLMDRLNDKHPEDRTKTIRQFYEEERPKLLKLPKSHLWPRRIEYAKIGKQPYARFEGNLYSMPPAITRTTVRLMVGMSDLEIYSKNDLVAIHERSFEKGKIIDDKEHLKELLETKGKSTSASYQRSYILRLIPDLEVLFADLANRQEPLAPIMARLNLLVDQFGIESLSEAVQTAKKDDSLRIDSLELLLSQKRLDPATKFHDPSLIRYSLPKHFRNIRTTHSNLAQYSKGNKKDGNN